MGSDIPSPDTLSLDEFKDLLAQYPTVLQAVSDSKGAKSGQQTLAELDAFRYGEAPTLYGIDSGGNSLDLEHVKQLVAWKLRHGKFRPTLMKLVSSNDAATVRTTVQEALKAYNKKRPQDTTAAALRILCKLRGIGPATASLLLAVHDPHRVVFFADEAYAWLCGGAAHTLPAKYNEREYADLCKQTAALQKRLGGVDAVQAFEVEQVAYVLLHRDSVSADSNKKSLSKAKKEEAKPLAKAEPTAKRKRVENTKEKEKETEKAPTGTVRRSQRIKKA